MQSHNLMPSVIHRDIKPSNIMRKEDGSLVLIDFGSVKDVMRDKNATISGTMGFMAPEQLMGEPVIASDFYSLGATILVLLSRKELEEMVENGIDLNWKSSIHTSNKMTYLLERLLEKDPKKRLNTLAEVKDILLTDKHEEKKTVDIVEKKANPQKRVKKKGIVRTPHAGDANSDFIDSLDTHYGYKKVNVLDTHYSSSHNSPYAYDIGKIKVTFFAILAIAAVFFFIFLANGGVSNYDDDNYKEEATAYIEHQRMLDERTKDLLKGLEKEKVEDLKKRKSLNFIEVDE